MLATPTIAVAEPTPTATVAVPVMATPTKPKLCNCYAYVRAKVPELPIPSLLKPNSTPKKGAVVIFKVRMKGTGELVDHYGTYMTDEGNGFWVDENNYDECVTKPRFVRWNDPTIVGFWVPN